jgi:hypothetical protein
MNSVGDEAVRRELLARLQSVGSGMSGGRSYTGGKGPSERSKAHAGRNPYIQFLKEIRRKPIAGEYDDYLRSKGLARAVPKVKAGIPTSGPVYRSPDFKWYDCSKNEINDPRTGRCISKSSKLGRNIRNTKKIYNQKTNRYVLISGKVGKKILAGGTVYE